MLFFRGAFALLAGVALAAPAVKDDSNAGRIARGEGIKRPARLFNADRTRGLAPRASPGPNDVQGSVAFDDPTPDPGSRKRATNVNYATVNSNGQIVLSTNKFNAAVFTLPDTSAGLGQLTWTPSTPDGHFNVGQTYTLFANLLPAGYATIGFGTPPTGAVTNFFTTPFYFGGLAPYLKNFAGTNQAFVWVADANNVLYLAPDMITATQAIPNARQLVPASFAPGSTPDFTQVKPNPASNGLINPTYLYATSWDQMMNGYVKLSGSGLSVAQVSQADATLFYAPDLGTGTNNLRIITTVNGQTKVVVSNSGVLSTNSGTSSNLRFQLETSPNVIIALTMNGNLSLAAQDLTTHALVGFVLDGFAGFGNTNRVCYEMVLAGAGPKYCSPFLASLQDVTYGLNPIMVYGSTASGSVAGKMDIDAHASYSFSSSGSGLNWSGRQKTSLYSKSYPNYYYMAAAATDDNTGFGPISGAVAGAPYTQLPMLQVQMPTGAGVIKAPGANPAGVSKTQKFFVSPSSGDLYVYETLAAAQTVIPDAEELCIESYVQGGSPSACQQYWANSPAAVSKNPTQLYVTGVGGNPVSGWITTGMGLSSSRGDASTWYFPQGPGTTIQAYQVNGDTVKTNVMLPGTQSGFTGNSAQPMWVSLTDAASLGSFWYRKWMTVPALQGGIVTPQFSFGYPSKVVSWIWGFNGYGFFLFEDTTAMVNRNQGFKQVCVETVQIGMQPTGACQAVSQ